MRIISGYLKGRRYSGNVPDSIRPTTDSAREAIFNVLNNIIDFDGISVLDLCAGTGFMGFEALSRGANNCLFVEKNPKNAKLIDTIAVNFKLETNNYTIAITDAVKYLKNIDGKMHFDLIFIDPPYATSILQNCIEIISGINLIADKGIIVAEHGTQNELLIPDKFESLIKKTFGTTVINFLINK